MLGSSGMSRKLLFNRAPSELESKLDGSGHLPLFMRETKFGSFRSFQHTEVWPYGVFDSHTWHGLNGTTCSAFKGLIEMFTM